MMKIGFMASCCALSLVLCLPLGAATVHVPGDQPTIQAGIDAAVDGDTVLVADGTWTGTGNKNLDYQGKAITVASENGPAACIIDCEGDGRGFIFQSGEGPDSLLEGFTIANGLEGLGGGIHCFESSPAMSDLVIVACHGTVQGGGIYVENASPAITGCIVDSCSSEYSGGGLYGLEASPTILNCTISGNDAAGEYPDGLGGGISFHDDSAPTIADSIFTANHAGWRGGGLYTADVTGLTLRRSDFESNTAELDGGAYCISSQSMEIIGCRFIENASLYSIDTGIGGLRCGAIDGLISENLIRDNIGGGVKCSGGLLFTRNTISGNTGESGLEVSGFCTVTRNTLSGNDCAIGAIYSYGPQNIISENIITGNVASYRGGGIYCRRERGVITGNLISGNTAADYGGGIYAHECRHSVFAHNMVIGNTANYGGGIMAGPDTTASFISNLVVGNTAGRGAGIACEDAEPWFWNMTVAGNTATQKGGGLLTLSFSNARVVNSIIWGNSAPEGPQVWVSTLPDDEISRLTLEYSDVEGGQADALVDPGCVLNWWAGMIDADPLFASGDLGDHYLGHIDSDQPETSPCVDTGNPAAGIVEGTTRTDGVPDTGLADMGFHYRYSGAWSRPYVVAGLGPGPDNPSRVRVFPPEEDADRVHAFQAYAAAHDGVTLACGDVNGDGGADLLTGPGPGQHLGPHVRGFTAAGGPLPGLSFIAYGTRKYGVNVAAGDFDGDGFDEIVTGPGPGPIFGPHVRGWQYDGRDLVNAAATVNFNAYATPKWGVNVACGDIDGDGIDEIVTGAGPGPVYGAHVRGWNVDDAPATAIPGVSFFAYGTPRYGVRVSCGDIDGDGIDEIVTAPGPSPAFGAHVRGWDYDGTTLTDMPGVSFFAWPPDLARHGATVFARADLDEDGRCEIVAGAGPDPALDSLVRVFAFDGSETTLSFSLQAFPDGWTHGASVAAGRF